MAVSTKTSAKKKTPPTATGMPQKLPYWLRYAVVQLTVLLMSQTLT
jgi:hypothetical protein